MSGLPNLRKTVPAIITLLWLLVCTVLLLLPGSQFPSPKWWMFSGLDKVIHVLIFFGFTLSFSVCSLIYWKKKASIRLFYWIAFWFFLYGVAIEFLQKWFIPFRSFSLWDIAADGLGCLLALVIMKFLSKRKLGKNISPRPI